MCLKCPPFLTFVLYPTKQVNYKVGLKEKNYALLLSPNNPTGSRKIYLTPQKQLLPGLLKKL